MANYKDIQLNFLDIETTGLSYSVDRIIEIYITKVVNNKVIEDFHTMLNPGFKPDPYITKLTGINYSDLKSAPNFEEIAEELYEFIKDGIIIAHNARFDYSFIKNELKNYGLDINLDYCCTVRLSRNLYPQYKKHGLDSIISRIQYNEGERHRASYDTEVIKTFFYKALKENGEERFIKAFNSSIKEAAIPHSLKAFEAKELPETSGVYIFYGDDNYPLYIGMSKNIRRRVLEHFYNDLINSKDLKINQKLKRIETIPTAGILGAYLRESILIKKYQPLFNRMLRKNRNLIKVEKYFDNDGYINLKINNSQDFDIDNLENIIGVFSSKFDLEDKLHEFVKTKGLCSKLLGMEKSTSSCFAYQLGQCKGACIRKISPDEYNKIFDEAFRYIKIANWPSDSEIKIVEESNGIREEFTFDKWCLVKSSQSDIEINDLDKYRFDIDTYKILNRYFKENSAQTIDSD